MALERVARGASGGGGGDDSAGSCDLAVLYPDLWAFLTLAKWPEDGTRREPGSLLLVWEQGRFKCWLNDKDAQRTCWVSADTLTTLLDVSNRVCGGSGGDWRPSKDKRRSK